MNYAILLSGGTGQRIDSVVPKQYLHVKGHMMVTYALRLLLRSEHIDRVCIVADERWRDSIDRDIRSVSEEWDGRENCVPTLEEDLFLNKIMGFSSPGVNRQFSIWNALEDIKMFRKTAGTSENKSENEDGHDFTPDSCDKDTVLIHDAARPCLTDEMLDAIYEALSGHDGVMPVLPMKDTVYLSKDGKTVKELLDRSKIYAGQAPELFVLDRYYEAVRDLLPDRIQIINGSSEPAIMAGMDIAMIPGDEANFKVTTEADLERFRGKLE